MKKKFDIVQFIIKIILGIIALISIFPFYNTVLVSFSQMSDVASTKVLLYPVSFDLSSYKILFSTGKVAGGLIISIIVTVGGTAFSMLVTTAGAYALSKKTMPGRNIIFNFIIVTMFFSGGLIPFFLTVKSLNLQNNILVMIIPVAANTFYLILMKNYLNTIPPSLEESAKIDGANDITILIRIVLPIAKPIIAAIALFYAVDRWNEWYTAMIFINNTKLFPLQLVLRDIIINATQLLGGGSGAQYARLATHVYEDSIKDAVIVISALPILMCYPLVQKYFASGIMMGSIKG